MLVDDGFGGYKEVPDPDPYTDPSGAPTPPPTTHTQTANPPPPDLTYAPAGYLGNQPIYKGSDGKYYQADQYNPDGSPKSYAEVSGFDPSQITPTNSTGTADRGTGAPATSGGSSGRGTLGDFAIDPSYLSPFLTPPPSYTKPGAFSYGDFTPPTADSIYADPSFKFRLDEGAHAIENSAAARGVLNTGGTLGDILKFGSQFASEEYPNIYNRALQSYSVNRGNASDSWDKNYRALYTDPFNFDTETWKNARDTFYQNQSNPFDKIFKTANLGASVASA